ncbi:MAG: VWA domain-containing protein [Anaerolineae bacterium]|jgi:Ca-activated chloride channel family protein|nr:VWA domain-containing protein [Anaerolineae bacterium]
MNEKDNNNLQVAVQTDKSVISPNKSSTRIVEINLTAPPAPNNQPRVPLNLSLVLDRSGSMHGEKLHYVKQAAAHVIDFMREEDSVTVVTYDDSVQTLANSQSLTQQVKAEIKTKIMGVETGSSTFLYGGWLAGCRSVAERATDFSFSRTLLLTDGLANVGERRLGPLSIHAQELFMRGISTSCFGVGSDYDEHLLEAMANLGGGNFHFLETVNAIPLVFEREFDEIINVVFRDVKIHLTLPESVTVEVSANWHSEREKDHLTIYLGSMTADQELPVYLQLTNGGAGTKESLLIPVRVTGKDAEQVNHELMATISLKAVPEAEEAAEKQDPEVMRRFAVVDLADKANEALKREREGDRAGSSQMMRDSLSLHSRSVPKSIQEKYQKLSDDMQIGLCNTFSVNSSQKYPLLFNN